VPGSLFSSVLDLGRISCQYIPVSLALEEIGREAMALPISERLALANLLFESAESQNDKSDEASAAW
jgi:hypothetical protein